MNKKFFCKRFKIVLVFIFLNTLSSCKKQIEVDVPFTSFNADNVFTTDATAIAAVTSFYPNISVKSLSGALGLQSLPFITGLSADELALYSPSPNANAVGLYTNNLTPATSPSVWNFSYQAIYQANAAIEGLNKSTTLTESIKKQLLGETKFIRAFYYFYLVSLYGDVPLALSTDYKINSLLARATADKVRQQIVEDLLDAKTLLNNNYLAADLLSSTAEKIRPNKWTATALLARQYLYMGDYANAEAQSTELINSGLYSLTTLNGTFLKGNGEAIWQLQPVNTGWNTEDARTFILPSTGPNTSTYPVYISKRLQNSFEPSDVRKTSWMDSVKVGTDTFYYAHKYKSATQNASVTEYNTVFRLAEQFLIRAEARARQNNMQGAIDDLDKVRVRAGLVAITISNPGISQSALIDKVFHERQVELFTEWGHRWLDLKRTGKVNSTMGIEAPLKGGSWETTDQFYPIPTSELITNPNLTQTEGY
jgi:hypothetical protein